MAFQRDFLYFESANIWKQLFFGTYFKLDNKNKQLISFQQIKFENRNLQSLLNCHHKKSNSIF